MNKKVKRLLKLLLCLPLMPIIGIPGEGGGEVDGATATLPDGGTEPVATADPPASEPAAALDDGKATAEAAKLELLKLLGIDDAETSEVGINALKSRLEKAEQAAGSAKTDTDAALARAVAAENKLAAINQGVLPAALDYVLSIVNGRDITEVVKELKGKPECAGFFSASGSTGTPPAGTKPQAAPNSAVEIAQRLGTSAAGGKVNSPYFN